MSRPHSSRSFIFSVFTLVILCVSGCADDLRNRSLFDCGSGDAVIRFSVENVALSRSDGDVDKESALDHAYLLFYAEDASLESDAPIAATRAEVPADNHDNLQFKMPLGLSPNTNYQLLAIANADFYVPEEFSNFTDYLNTWSANNSENVSNPLMLFTSSVISLEEKSGLPMKGIVSGNSFFRFSQQNGSYHVSASLSFRRLVSRIDVANIVKEGFRIEEVALCNWRDAVPVTTSVDIIGNRFGSIHAVLSDDASLDSDFVFMPIPETDGAGIQTLSGSIYCFPSFSNVSSLSDKESTALIIKAKYGDDSESSYYRVNVGLKGNVSQINPNTKYLVTIQSVKNRGAASPKEAYSSTESPIVLSVVEDWDLEDGHFDMDEYGNFIVVSQGSPLEFQGDDLSNRLIKVLTSKALAWDVEYIPDNEESASAFNVVKLGNAISIGPNDINESNSPLSGNCLVSALTEQGNRLEVSIPLLQKEAEEKPYEPEIPTHLSVSILPVNGEHVKIDHEKMVIEIDAFDPDCFNSFIDIPFKVFVNDNYQAKNPISFYSDLEWPLEGCISKTKHSDFYYCPNTFGSVTSTRNKNVYSKTYDREYTYSEIIVSQNGFNASKDDIVYISVGAMAPDDPEIRRTLTITSDNAQFVQYKYALVIKPRPVIIDDVILTDQSGRSWLIFDRNIQNTSSSSGYFNYIGRTSEGLKSQAYNYTSQVYNIDIPFKSSSENSMFNETLHVLYKGSEVKFKEISSQSSTNPNPARKNWLTKYLYVDGQQRTSPFFENDNIDKWCFPSKSVLELCVSKLHVSKMRMYLVSDVYAKSGRNAIPICCYLPYHGFLMGDTSNETFGYFTSDDFDDPNSMILIFCDKTDIGTYTPTSSTISNFTGLSRLVRPLTSEELEDYKKNYLGYGNQPLLLSPCHPDTYTSEGWLKY